MPNSACTAGSTTDTTYMLLLPSTTKPSVVSNRQAAWRESMSEAGAAADVEAGEDVGVSGMPGNLPDEVPKGTACQAPSAAKVRATGKYYFDSCLRLLDKR